MLSKFHEFQSKAEIYYVYHTIQRYTDEPFTSQQAETLFNMAKYLWHAILKEVPHGVSKVYPFMNLVSFLSYQSPAAAGSVFFSLSLSHFRNIRGFMWEKNKVPVILNGTGNFFNFPVIFVLPVFSCKWRRCAF